MNTAWQDATFVSVKFGSAIKLSPMSAAIVNKPMGQQQSFAQQFISPSSIARLV
ncbi:hypothetical protein [Glaciecola sp. SC05]|uniref:hypothetical protein n=1 Tax=Glaciecola sp. SC05 TaxID=1987355 RepID=UPI0035291FEA